MTPINRRELPTRETLQVEFKSDRKRLRDDDLVLAVVCLANTEGGCVYLGVEDDGTPTGLDPDHRDMPGLEALVANRTVPPLGVRASLLDVAGRTVAKIEVPRSTRLVSTTSGTLQRRRLMLDGRPECVPFLPHEFASREADLRLIDFSARSVAGATHDALDPVERHRLRQAVERYGGDRALLGLSDLDLEGALGLSHEERGRRVPTVAGLLLIGRDAAIREHLPTHEVAFQVLAGTSVQVNDFYRWPLIRLFERIDEQFRARVVEAELEAGLFRVPVPNVEPRVFREALVNALTHRDYARLGAVHIQWRSDALAISSPGGFVEGVTLENLLVVDPRPRNPLLADAFKRIGLAERTGRGVDRIFEGVLRFGRPAPSYTRSDRNAVVVELSCAEADMAFLALVLEQEERLAGPIALESLLVLSTLRTSRRADVSELAAVVQRDVSTARAALERLVEAGFIVAHGVKKGRTYTLSPAVYRRLGQGGTAYVRQAGFDRLQQEKLVENLVTEDGRVSRRDVMELCRIGPTEATRLLGSLVDRGILIRRGERRWSYYERV